MSDKPSPLTSGPVESSMSLESLAAAHESLRRAFHITLVMLIILAGSLFVFFLREISIARQQISTLTATVIDYERNAVPLMEDFRTKLQVFAKNHPDFMPIYAKYFGSNALPAVAAPGRAQPMTNPPGPRLPPSR